MTQDAKSTTTRPFVVTARDEQSATIQLSRGRGAAYTPSASSTASQNAALDRQTQQNLASTQTLFAGGKPYPEMPKISPVRPMVRSLGATGTAILGGIITSEEYNEDFYWKDGVRIYEQMLRSEGQIAALRSSIELPIRRTTWSIEPGSQDERDLEIASFVETCLFHELRYTTSEGRVLTQKWDDVLRHALMCLWYGFMPFEQVWRLDDGWVKWARFIPLLPRTIWRWWVGEDNELVGIQQWTFKNYGYQFTDIPADKLLLFVHRQEGNNYEGVSLLRQAYQHWWYKQQLYKIEAIGIEHNAISIPVIRLPENFTPNDVNAANSQLVNLRANESMGVVLPPGWEFQYAPNYQKHAMEIQPTIQHHDVLIARSALAQFLNLGSTETGAFALADVQTKTFLESLQAVCEYIEDVFNNDAIRRLVDYNFADVETYPKLKAGKVALTDVKDIAGALATLVNMQTPIIHPDPQLEDFMRDQLGLPKAPVGQVQGTDPSAPTNDAQPENANAGETSDEGAAGQNSNNGGNASGQQSQPPDNTSDPGEGDGNDGGSSAMSELRLLREAFAAVAAFDAVERGAVHLGTGYNPYRDPHGKFAPGPHAQRPGEGEGRGGGGAAPKAKGGKGKAGGNAGAAKAKAVKPKPTEEEAKAAAAVKAKGHQEFEASHAAVVAKQQGGKKSGTTKQAPMPTAAKANYLPHKVTVGQDKVTVTVSHPDYGKVKTSIEPDHHLGGYKITSGKFTYEGNSAAGVNAFLAGFTGKTGVFDKGTLAPGPKVSAAAKAAYKKEQEYNKYVPKGGNTAQKINGPDLEYHLKNGEMLSVSHTSKGFAVKYVPTHDVKGGHLSTLHLSMPKDKGLDWAHSTYQEVKAAKEVNALLKQHGVSNTFSAKSMPAKPSSPHGGITYTPASTSANAVGHAPTHAVLEESAHGYAPGHYVLKNAYHSTTIPHEFEIKREDGGFHLTYRTPGGVTPMEEAHGLSGTDAAAHLEARGLHSDDAKFFTKMAEHDYQKYVAPPTSKEQEARIAATTARKAELDKQLGTYSEAAAKAHVATIYNANPGLRDAIDEHLAGGSGTHLGVETITRNMHGDLARATQALNALHDVSEWSLLHAPGVTREGTLRLFHGTNGDLSKGRWEDILSKGRAVRGTPFTSNIRVAHSFAGSGHNGRSLISAHVPVSSVAIWHGIRNDHSFTYEREYTVTRDSFRDWELHHLGASNP